MNERKNREAFRELLKENIERGSLTYKTKWRHFVEQIKDDKRLFNMLGQNGSTPRELFEDQVEILKENHKRIKDDFKKLIKDKSIKPTAETSFESFDALLRGQEDYDKLDNKTKEYFYNYFIDKAKAKEKESLKKHKKALKRYVRFLKTLPDIKPDSDFKSFEKVINENEQFAGLTQEEKASAFVSYLQDLKTQDDEGQISDDHDGERHKKKRSKKRRKNKKKNYDSSDNEGESDESRSRSRSATPADHKRTSRKDRFDSFLRTSLLNFPSTRKTHKIDHSAGSEEYSDGEKRPEKKVFAEADLAPKTVEPQQPLAAAAETKIQEEKQAPEAPKEDKEEREEGETKESLARGRQGSVSSRSESAERSRKKKKDRKHSKKKKNKSDRKSKKKHHKKRSYTPSDSSDDDD